MPTVSETKVRESKVMSRVEEARAKIVKLAKVFLREEATAKAYKSQIAVLNDQKRDHEQQGQEAKEHIAQLSREVEVKSVVTDEVTVVVKSLPDKYSPVSSDCAGVAESFVTKEVVVKVSLNVEAIEAYVAKHGDLPNGVVAERGRYSVAVTDKRKNRVK